MELLQRSRSIADQPVAERARLLSPWALLGMALGTVLVLALIFPKQTLVAQISSQQQGNSLTVSYLKNLLRTDPDNRELEYQLARQKMLLGELDEAGLILARLRRQGDNPELRRRAEVLDMNLRVLQARAYAADPRKREEARAALRQAMEKMAAEGWDEGTLQELAVQAAQLRESDIAGQLYRRLAEQGKTVSPRWFAEAARLALGDGNYALAAELYFAAQRRAPSRSLRREYFLAGLKTLQSGNLLRQAMAAADKHLGDLADDPETLYFLANLARSANDLPRAEDYVKRLLRLSDAAPRRALLAALLDFLVPAAQADEHPALRPYDEKIYTLAYEVFLANRNLKDAYRIAKAAVAARPDDHAWLQRLAQVAEWGGKPEEALATWKRLAYEDNLAEAWQGVLRLAPGLKDDEALLAAWKHEAVTRPLTPAEWDFLIAAFESRGDPGGAIALLRRVANGDAALLERLAALDERADRLDDAIAAYAVLERRPGVTTPVLVRYAVALLARDRQEEALAMLLRHRDKAAESEGEYWGLLGEMGWRLQQDEAAEYAYRKLTAGSGEKADATAYERLLALLKERYPDEALVLAERGAARFGTPDLVLSALELAWGRQNLSAMARVFGAIPREARSRIEGTAYYWTLRAQYRQARGEKELAMRNYRRAISLAPADSGILAAYLWLLVEMQDGDRLRVWLSRVDGRLGKEEELSKVAAAAYLALGRADRALPLMEREARQQKNDYLWQLGYADALEQAGRGNQAWKARYRAWRELRASLAKGGAARGPDKRLPAYVQLAARFAPADDSLAALRLLLRQDSPAADKGEQGETAAQAKELALSWALSQERSEAAKAWLWRNYARNLAAPRWAAVSLALKDNDLDTLERLFEQGGGLGIPRFDRVEAARSLGRVREAQSLAFASLDYAPDDDQAHEVFANLVMDTASSLQGEVRPFRRGVLSGVERTLTLGWWVSPVLKVEPSATVVHQGSDDETALPGVPAVDRRSGVRLTYRGAGGEWSARLGRRTAVDTFTEAQAGFSSPDRAGFQWSAALRHNAMASETSALRVGGMKDQAEGNVNYAFSGREYLRTRLWKARYYSQWRDYLAQGHGLDWEVGHRFRLEYPDLSLRLGGAAQHFKRDGAGDALLARLVPGGTAPSAEVFLPENYQYYGVSLGYGDYYRDHYSRKLRSFASVGFGHNTLTGAAHNLSIGATTSVIGKDRFTFGYDNAKGGTGTGDTLWELWLQYEYFL